jgi:hypothetical protein
VNPVVETLTRPMVMPARNRQAGREEAKLVFAHDDGLPNGSPRGNKGNTLGRIPSYITTWKSIWYGWQAMADATRLSGLRH